MVTTYKGTEFRKGAGILDLERARMRDLKPFPQLNRIPSPETYPIAGLNNLTIRFLASTGMGGKARPSRAPRAV